MPHKLNQATLWYQQSWIARLVRQQIVAPFILTRLIYDKVYSLFMLDYCGLLSNHTVTIRRLLYLSGLHTDFHGEYS